MITSFTNIHLALFAAQPSVATLRGGPKGSVANNIVSAANGGKPIEDDSRAPSQLRSLAFDSMFSVNHVDATERKIDLMQRVGKAFGLQMEDFSDLPSFGKKLREAFRQLDPMTIHAR